MHKKNTMVDYCLFFIRDAKFSSEFHNIFVVVGHRRCSIHTLQNAVCLCGGLPSTTTTATTTQSTENRWHFPHFKPLVIVFCSSTLVLILLKRTQEANGNTHHKLKKHLTTGKGHKYCYKFSSYKFQNIKHIWW